MTNLKSIVVALGLGTMMVASAFGQGTAFTYQGRLNNGTNVATGTYDLQFGLFTTNVTGTAVAGLVTKAGTAVSNGLFTVTLDFGGAFTGTSNWLELAVRTNGAATFNTLMPRQQLTPIPYAVYAESANATNLVGWVQPAKLSGVALLAGGNAFTGNQTVTSGSVGIGTSTPARQLDVTGSAAGVPSGGSVDSSLFLKVGNAASDGNTSIPDVAGISFGRDSTRQAIVGGTFGNDYLSFYTGGSMTAPKMQIDFAGNVLVPVGIVGIGTPVSFASELSISQPGSVTQLELLKPGQNIGYQFSTDANGIDICEHNIACGRFYIQNGSGNIGLGTTAPAEKLTIAGVTNYNSGLKLTGSGANGTGLALENTASGGHKYDLMSSASLLTAGGTGSFQVYDETAGFARLTLNSSGNLGIGTTLPDRPLTITATPTVNSEWLSLQNKAGTTKWHLNNVNGGVNFAQTGVADGRLFLSTNGDGYVGMGTTTPTENLTIAGVTNYNSGLKLTGSTVNGTGMALENTSSGGHKYVFVSAGSADQIAAGCFGLGDDTALAYRFVVNASGNFGIGTTAPNTEKLVVSGGGDFTAPAANAGNDSGVGISFESYGGRIDSFQLKPLILNPSGNRVGVFTTTPQYQLDVNGEIGCTAINLTSDRNAKQDFQAIDPLTVLAKVAALPITEWQYKAEKDKDAAANRHIGPMAQDFTAAFALSQDDKHISVVDEGGVALAAIQGLNEKLEEKNQEVETLKQNVAELRALVNQLAHQQSGTDK